MEPITCGLAIASLLGSTLWEAAVGIAGQQAAEKIKRHFTRRVFRNHDVQRVMREALDAALLIIEKEYRKTSWSALTSDERSSVEKAIKNLRNKAFEFFPTEGEPVVPDATAPEFLAPGEPSRRLARVMAEQAGEVPPSFRATLESSFPDAFVFCFKEIGLKRDEKVRSVIYYEMMRDLQGDVHGLVESMQRLEGEQRFRARFEEQATETLGAIHQGVARIEEKVDRLLQGGDVKAIAHVFAGGGEPLSKHPITAGGVVTIGRDATNKIQLPDQAVSGRHAELVTQGMYFQVRDLGSRNGTFVGPKQVKSSPVGFGDKIRIGPYVIEIRETQGVQDLEVPPTLPTS